jgi:hypothetical protein
MARLSEIAAQDAGEVRWPQCARAQGRKKKRLQLRGNCGLEPPVIMTNTDATTYGKSWRAFPNGGKSTERVLQARDADRPGLWMAPRLLRLSRPAMMAF